MFCSGFDGFFPVKVDVAVFFTFTIDFTSFCFFSGFFLGCFFLFVFEMCRKLVIIPLSSKVTIIQQGYQGRPMVAQVGYTVIKVGL